MNKFEAEKVVNAYGAAIARGTDGKLIRRAVWLPFSKAKIKQAYFIYIDAMIKDFGILPEKIGGPLVQTYSMMKLFVDEDEAKELLDIEKRFYSEKLDASKPEHKKLLNRYASYSQKMMDGELYDEIKEFISECLEKNKLNRSDTGSEIN